MIQTALNVGSHHSHTGQRVLRKIVSEKWLGSKLEVWELSTSVLQFRGKALNLHSPEQKKNKKTKKPNRLSLMLVVGGQAYLRAALGPLFPIKCVFSFESTV